MANNSQFKPIAYGDYFYELQNIQKKIISNH